MQQTYLINFEHDVLDAVELLQTGLCEEGVSLSQHVEDVKGVFAALVLLGGEVRQYVLAEQTLTEILLR